MERKEKTENFIKRIKSNDPNVFKFYEEDLDLNSLLLPAFSNNIFLFEKIVECMEALGQKVKFYKCMQYAMEKGDKYLVDVLIKRGYKHHQLMGCQTLDILKIIAKDNYKINKNLKDDLEYFVDNCDFEFANYIAKMIKERKVDIDWIDPIFIAISIGDERMAGMLRTMANGPKKRKIVIKKKKNKFNH
jgi:hypothetical protein